MISIGSNGEKIAYGIKHYNLDTEADIARLPIQQEKMGCTCFVIETSKYYMLNGQSKWVEITPFGKAVNPSVDVDGDGVPDDIDPSIDIIYDGGHI